MARGEKTTEYEHGFEYSHEGSIVEGTAITVRAPGLVDLAVHARMQSICNRALIEFFPVVKKMRDEARDDEEAETAAAEADAEPAEGKKKPEIDALQIISYGLGEDGYASFVAWLKKTLTGNARLAFVAGTRQPLTDEIWASLEDRGALKSVLSVLSDFSSFFFTLSGETSASESASGAGSSSTSASAPKEVLITRTPRRSR